MPAIPVGLRHLSSGATLFVLHVDDNVIVRICLKSSTPTSRDSTYSLLGSRKTLLGRGSYRSSTTNNVSAVLMARRGKLGDVSGAIAEIECFINSCPCSHSLPAAVKVHASPFCRCSSVRWFVGALMVVSFSLIHNFRDGLMSEAQDDNSITSNQRVRQRRVRFIPYPHKTLGSGSSLQCQWETRPLQNSSTSNEASLDFTQQNAYTEGFCIPPTLNETLHIFSSEEAIECLSSQVQNRDIKLMISGDSYMKQLTIGLADILLSKHICDDKEMVAAGPRDEVLSVAHREMGRRRSEEENSTFPFVKYVGKQCYGTTPLNTTCTDMIDQLGGDNSTDYVWIIGSAVHIYARLVNATTPVRATIHEISNFLDTTKQILFVSPPFYYPDERFTDQLVQDQAEIYRGLLPNVAPENAAHPFLDVYELTRSCQWENCSYDRAHRSRFVNRWKAQLLLNTLCEIEVQ